MVPTEDVLHRPEEQPGRAGLRPAPAVVVPRGGADRWRIYAWNWIRPRYAWPVVEGFCGGEWVKARAVGNALGQTAADLLVVADCDCWCPGVDDAVQAVIDGAAWAVPHLNVYRLAPSSTQDVLLGEEPHEGMVVEEKHRGMIGGGIVVIRRDVYEDCPLDPRFVGWGREDQAWAGALCTLYGTPWRGTAPLFHLWHPPQPRRDRDHGSDETEALYKRYCGASGNEHMRPLIEEAKCHSTVSSSAT